MNEFLATGIMLFIIWIKRHLMDKNRQVFFINNLKGYLFETNVSL